MFPLFQSINVYIDADTLHLILNEVDLNKNGRIEQILAGTGYVFCPILIISVLVALC